MKRVIRSTVDIESAGIVDIYKALKRSLTNYFHKLGVDIGLTESKKDGTEIWKVTLDDGRYMHVSIRPVKGEPGYVSLHYRTQDGTIQDRADIGIRQEDVDDAILNALEKFYDWDSYETAEPDNDTATF